MHQRFDELATSFTERSQRGGRSERGGRGGGNGHYRYYDEEPAYDDEGGEWAEYEERRPRGGDREKRWDTRQFRRSQKLEDWSWDAILARYKEEKAAREVPKQEVEEIICLPEEGALFCAEEYLELEVVPPLEVHDEVIPSKDDLEATTTEVEGEKDEVEVVEEEEDVVEAMLGVSDTIEEASLELAEVKEASSELTEEVTEVVEFIYDKSLDEGETFMALDPFLVDSCASGVVAVREALGGEVEFLTSSFLLEPKLLEADTLASSFIFDAKGIFVEAMMGSWIVFGSLMLSKVELLICWFLIEPNALGDVDVWVVLFVFDPGGWMLDFVYLHSFDLRTNRLQEEGNDRIIKGAEFDAQSHRLDYNFCI